MAKRTNFVAWGLVVVLVVGSGVIFASLSGWQVTTLSRQHWGFGKERFPPSVMIMFDAQWFRLGLLAVRQVPPRPIIWASPLDHLKRQSSPRLRPPNSTGW
jgi:hypothetical protein